MEAVKFYLKRFPLKNFSRRRRIAFFTALLLFFPGNARAEISVIKLMMDASKAIVSVTAEAGGIFSNRPQGAFDKATGQILIAAKVAPVYFVSRGAGFILDPSGIVVTNAHIVQNGGRITVTLCDNSQFPGNVLHLVPEADLAFVKITVPHGLPFIPLGDSDKVKLDTPVYTTGNSELIRGSLSEGRVSGIGTSRGNPQAGVATLQINFTLYKGDSGSPVMNARGELLGMISSQTRPDVIYAVPSNIIRQSFLQYLAKNPTVLAPSPPPAAS